MRAESHTRNSAAIDLYKYGAPAGCIGYNFTNVIFGPMRTESHRDEIATVIQSAYTARLTAYEAAGRVLAAQADRRNLTFRLAERLAQEGYSEKKDALISEYEELGGDEFFQGSP